MLQPSAVYSARESASALTEGLRESSSAKPVGPIVQKLNSPLAKEMATKTNTRALKNPAQSHAHPSPTSALRGTSPRMSPNTSSIATATTARKHSGKSTTAPITIPRDVTIWDPNQGIVKVGKPDSGKPPSSYSMRSPVDWARLYKYACRPPGTVPYPFPRGGE